MPGVSKKRVLVIAGFGPGLGDALVARFSNAEYRIITLSRRPLTDIPDLVHGEKVTRHFECDLVDADAVNTCFSTIQAEYGPVDCLIHNAMQLVIEPFGDLDATRFQNCWEACVLTAFNCASQALKQMQAREQGTLIFTGATAALRGGKNFAAFASAKFALRGLCQSLAREYGPRGVHVVHTILDGLIWSPQTIARFDPEEAGCLQPDAIAGIYLDLVNQPSSTWTQELDIRPSVEVF